MDKPGQTKEKYLRYLLTKGNEYVKTDINCFVKREPLLGKELTPRLIQPRDDNARNLTGPIIEKISEVVYRNEHMVKFI
jgi:hypothetical protein